MSRSRLPIKQARSSPPTPYIKRGMPFRDLVASVLFNSPIHRRNVPTNQSLIREQWRIGRMRSPDRLSQLEAYVVSMGISGAEQIRDRGAEQLATLVDQTDGMRAQIVALRADSIRLDQDPVFGVNGELLSVQEAQNRLQAVTAAVEAEGTSGTVKHRRISERLRHVTLGATVVDFIPLLWFTAAVFNVNWSAIDQTVVQFATSIVFALLGTAAITLSLSVFGRDIKGYKGDEGHIRVPKGRAATIPLLMVTLSTVVAVGAAVLMGYRVISESVTAGNGLVAGVILGVFFGAIVLTLHVLVFMVHYRDGSPLTDELDHLAGQVAAVKRKRLGIQQRIDQLGAQLSTQHRKAAAIREQTLAKLARPVKGATQRLLASRSYHHGVGWSADLLGPEAESLGLIAPVLAIDTRVLDRLMARVHGEVDTDPDGGDEEPRT